MEKARKIKENIPFINGKTIKFSTLDQATSKKIKNIYFSKVSPLATYSLENHRAENLINLSFPCEVYQNLNFVWNLETGKHIQIGN